VKRTLALAIAAGLFASACVTDRSKPPQAPGFSWIVQASGTDASLRGVSVVDDRTAWASGSKGTVLRTLDGGSTWILRPVKGAETTDFRDIEAFSQDEAVIMGIDRPAKIFRTTDGGETWTQTFADDSPGVFLDGLAFFDEKNGLAVGDPMDGKFFVISTTDGGATWALLPPDSRPDALAGEAAFAASGTSLAVLNDDRVWLSTGGPASRVWRSEDRGRNWEPVSSALLEGSPSAGGFSVAFLDAETGLTVGGDYKAESAAVGNAAFSADGGKTWRAVEDRRPGGFREAVAFVPGTKPPVAITVGPSGSDFSLDLGKTWTPIVTPAGFHALDFARRGRAGWAVGRDGLVAKLKVSASPSNAARPIRIP
jgi:photosystem II stability/assembly factor-like uncharacterized protein